MLNRIVNFSLNNRLIIIFASCLLLAYGSYIAVNMEVDVFPDLTAPTVVVLTEAHGMAPEEVEQLVTFKVETSVNGAQMSGEFVRLLRLESQSCGLNLNGERIFTRLDKL